MKKILISVAPVSAADTSVDPEKVAEDVIACAKAGAGMVHLHIRDRQGNLTPDLSAFKETVERIREESDIIIQASTGGVSDLTIKERCAPLYYDAVETTSLNVGSCNLGEGVYLNPVHDVRYCISEIIKMKKIPEIEVFEIGMIHTVTKLMGEFDFSDPVLFSIVLGHPGIAPPTVEGLIAMRSFIPHDCLWGITHAYRKNLDIITAAIGLGASTVRIGFEDSQWLDESTQAETNLPIVERIARLIEASGNEAASPEEGRKMLNVPLNSAGSLGGRHG